MRLQKAGAVNESVELFFKEIEIYRLKFKFSAIEWSKNYLYWECMENVFDLCLAAKCIEQF